MTAVASAATADAVGAALRAADALARSGRLVQAQAHYQEITDLRPDHAVAHNNLGWVRSAQGDTAGALAAYRRALALAPALPPAVRNLTVLLVRLGRVEECLSLWQRREVATPANLAWLDRLAWATLDAGDYPLGGEYGRLFAHARWHSGVDHAGRRVEDGRLAPVPVPYLSVAKLWHDVEQFRYLRGRGLLGDGFDAVVKAYEQVIDRLDSPDVARKVPLSKADEEAIGHVFNRLVHLGSAPRLERALSTAWDPGEVEERYLAEAPGVVVVDDFLTPEALASLRAFCLESTVWSANRYAHGRLGAFFRDGFNCPLLLQIAQELREALPCVIGRRYPLRQLWAFKNGHTLPRAESTHADFAAVNVNFWITSTEANLDPDSGGLLIHCADAPPDWDFGTYNSRQDIIGAYLRGRRELQTIKVPYRANRAIIFNSDLFHGTDGVRFRPGYENRRINITMLYGERADDIHHRNPQGDPQAGTLAPGADSAAWHTAPWRSAAFTRARTERR